MWNVSYEHSITYTRLQNQFFSIESILACYKENPSLPPSPVSSLSSVIASPQLNPLYYSHVSAFVPLCPRPAEPFLWGCFFVWRHAFVLHSPALPQHRLHLHPPCHTVCFVRHISRADLWRPPQCGHTQGSRRPADIFPIWPLALAPRGAGLSFYRPLKVYISEGVWLGCLKVGDGTHHFPLSSLWGNLSVSITLWSA